MTEAERIEALERRVALLERLVTPTVLAGYYPATVGQTIVVEGDFKITGHAGVVKK
jgi:hypothetical protein